jgi:hypothetical protein
MRLLAENTIGVPTTWWKTSDVYHQLGGKSDVFHQVVGTPKMFTTNLVVNIRFTTNLVVNIRFTTNLAENRDLFTSFTPQKASTFVSPRGRRKAVCILVASSRHSMCADETHRFAETSTEGGWIGKVQCFAQNDTLLLLVLSNPHRYI